MKANLAILALLFFAFHVGTEALKCYKDQDGKRIEETCAENEKCLLKELEFDDPPQAFGCVSDKRDEHCPKSSKTCIMCGTYLCNALKCYNSKEKKPQVCELGNLCIWDRSNDEMKCGRCKGHDRDADECKECTNEMCNGPPLKCYDNSNQELQCEDIRHRDTRQKCITIMDGGRAVEKKCGICLDWEVGTFHRDSEECEECDSDKCDDRPVQSLNCYDVTNQLTKCEDVHDKCITIMHRDLKRPIDKMCGTCRKWQMQSKSNDECVECNSDECNKEPPIQALKCYNTADQLNPCENILDNCITITNNGRLVEKKCGHCPKMTLEMSEKCEECTSDSCNNARAKSCYDANNQLKKCERVHDKCITIMDGGRAVDKKCGTCTTKSQPKEEIFQQQKTSPQPEENFRQQNTSVEECKQCDTDGCNEEFKVQILTCFNTNNQVEVCKNARDHCYTEKQNFFGGQFAVAQEKGCGRCNTTGHDFGGTFCENCYHNECNNEPVEEKIDCYTGGLDDEQVQPCAPGQKCVIYYTKDRRNGYQWTMSRACHRCPIKPLNDPRDREFELVCKQCNTSLCNVINWPKCKAGAGNGAGDFFVDSECKKRYINKDLKVTTTCIKQQVEGITYKDCGSCGAFVHPVNQSALPPGSLPPGKDKPDINKCKECESSEGGDPCNGGILAHHMPVSFWLLLVIGACMPWLLLSMVSPFVGV